MGYRSRRIPPALRGAGINLGEDEVYQLLTGIRFSGAFETEQDERTAWSRYGANILRTLASDDPRVTVVGRDFSNVLPRGATVWAAERFGVPA
jgi:hypothetical protein